MVQISWQDIEAGAISQQPLVVRESYNAAKQFACGLYGSYQQYFGNVAPQGPLEGLKRGVWDKICGPTLPPVPTAPPPWDGQTCACKTYRVTVKSRSTSQVVTEGIVDVTGPVFGLVDQFPNAGLASWAVRHGVCSGGAYTGATLRGVITTSRTDDTYIESSVLLSGPAGCPVPSPAPVPPPVPPPPERQRIEKPIQIAPNVTINAPIILVKPTLNNNIDLGVEVAVGGINFNFSLGGVEFNLNPTFSPTLIAPTINLPPLPPSTPRPPALPPAGGGGDCPDPCEEFDYERVENAIKAERKYYARPKKTSFVVPLGSGRGGTVSIPVRTLFVRVRITKEPNSVKEQAGTGGVDVLYAGWCGWGKSAPGDRTPISYRDNSYAVPVGCDVFSWTLYAGALASVEAIVEGNLPECETYECG